MSPTTPPNAEAAAPRAVRSRAPRSGGSPTAGLGKRRDVRGAALIEFALIFPVLIAIILGGIDGGVALQARTAVINAARDGVRTAATGGSAADIETAIANSMSILPGSYTVTFTCVKKSGNPCGADIGTELCSGGRATVTISYAYESITGFYPFFNFTMDQTAQMRIE